MKFVAYFIDKANVAKDATVQTDVICNFCFQVSLSRSTLSVPNNVCSHFWTIGVETVNIFGQLGVETVNIFGLLELRRSTSPFDSGHPSVDNDGIIAN